MVTRVVHDALAVWLVLAAGSSAGAATTGATPGYPNRPVRVIVPQSAGGSTDLAARIVLQRMSESTGQTFVVDNRPGAGSLNGTDTVAKSAPDGYTLLAVAASFSINPSLHKDLPFDPVRDFAPVTRFAAL